METIVTPVTVITLDSTKITHNIKADLVARYFPPVVRLVQYDQSLPVIAVSLMQNGQTYTLPSGAAANIRVHKPDATYVYNPALGCDSTRNIVYFEVTQAMATANGDGLAIVEIVVDGDIAGTSLITLHFEENPVPEDAIESSDEWETIYELGERIIASTVTPVSTAAGMIDQNVVYLYTGTESGWNQGHMYYYNGTTWVDAGIAVTDTTLSVSGLAADAKATGDRFNSLDAGDIEYDDSETYSSGTVGSELSDLMDDLDAVTDQINATLIMDTASGAIASFPDGADGVPVKDLTISIEPAQSGSGDPSPSNVRPISGWTQAIVTVSPTTVAEDGQTYTIDLDGTRYGGTLDVTTGVLTVDMVKIIADGTNIKTTGGYGAYGALWLPAIILSDTAKNSTTVDNLKASYLKTTPSSVQTLENSICIGGGGQLIVLHIGTMQGTDGTHGYNSANEVHAAVNAYLQSNNMEICYRLAEPFTVQLTAQQVTTLLGQNNIWADCGNTTVEYRADTKLYIDKKLSS